MTRLRKQRSAYEPKGFLEDLFPAWMTGTKDDPAMQARIDQWIDEQTAELEELQRQEAIIKQRGEQTAEGAKTKGQAVTDLKNRIKSGRGASGKLFEDIITGDQAIETFRRHRGVIGPIEQKARGLETESEAGRADREDEERRQREAEREQRQMERSLHQFFKEGAATGGASTGAGIGAAPIVTAIQNNTAGLEAAFASIEQALKAQGRTIKIANARFESFHRSSIG